MMQKKIMVVGAHADDVELHFGGTLFKYMDKGYAVIYVQSTNNMSGSIRTYEPDGGWLKRIHRDTVATMDYRKREAAAGAALYNTEPVHLDHPQLKGYSDDGRGKLQLTEVRYGSCLPDGVPADVPTILTAYIDDASIQRLTGLILEHQPEAVFTHPYADVNIEHTGTARLVEKAYSRAVASGCQAALLHNVRVFPQLGRMANCWETFIDIDGYVDRRAEAIDNRAQATPWGWQGGWMSEPDI